MVLTLLVFIGLLLLPSAAFAWGPLTHVYLGSELYYMGSFLPAALYGILRKYRQDFLYGNIMADIIIGKKYTPKEKNSHSWHIAVDLLESARTPQEEAFCMGYMSHLAADTVAHGRYTAGLRNLEHTLVELRADSFIDRSYWFQAVAIERSVQRRNDEFLERSLHRGIFSFKTNSRIFKGFVALSVFNQQPLVALREPGRLLLNDRMGDLPSLHEESLDRMLDVLLHGKRSEVLKKDPCAKIRGGKVLKTLLG